MKVILRALLAVTLVHVCYFSLYILGYIFCVDNTEFFALGGVAISTASYVVYREFKCNGRS